MINRRQLLASTASIAVLMTMPARSRSFKGGVLPFEPGAADPPKQVLPGPWLFFTPVEARAVEAIVERLVPADELSISGKEAGCAVFIDRQMAGQYGAAARLYMRPPFMKGLPTQGDQAQQTPAQRYRLCLAELDTYCRKTFANRAFAELSGEERDGVLHQLEDGKITFDGPISAAEFFKLVLQNTMEGFFADPIYGGNKEMVSWKMLGFPGVRYDFRDHVLKHNQRYPLPPVSILGRAEWRTP